ncbi:MAG: hypothetical protein B9S33_03820 [Pedosphaera sp. Tous-C6FEB]|nr:MAG: hypothetical protein B9S33_03820 [Pedosphaera sp. Tous-C6FEB]
MQTLTVRELSRETARVLNTCDHEGRVLIRHTDGREYVLAPTQPRRKRGQRQLPDFAKRREAILGNQVFSEKFINGILDKGEH